MDELRVLSANGLMHGSGFPKKSLERGLDRDPHFIGIDSGSTDAGPYYLGSGDSLIPSKQAAKSVLRPLLLGARQADIPLLIGSAATGGTTIQVDWLSNALEEVAQEEGLSFNLAKIYADQSDNQMRDKLAKDQVQPLDQSPPLTEKTINSSDQLVGVMGPEPYIEALEQDADVVVAGRSSDVAIFKAIPLQHGFDEGLATHLAKTIECGGQIALPETSGDVILGTLTDEYFRVEPTNPEKYTNPTYVASHLLYETANPFEFVEPRGVLNTRDCKYEAVDDATVEVSGSEFNRADQYTIKLEGASSVGHRAVSMLGIRDPELVENQLDSFLSKVERSVLKRAKAVGADPDQAEIYFHRYGLDGVMKENEPNTQPAHEVGVFLEIVAGAETAAKSLLHLAGNEILHTDFPGRKCTSGNAAFPVSPSDISAGEAYEFTVWHTMEVDDPLGPFDVQVAPIGGDLA